MTVQFGIVLILALLCVGYFLKDLLRSALGVDGACGSCGSCKSGGCPVKKLEAIQADPDPTKSVSR